MDEADIFHEWLKKELELPVDEIIDPLEYIFLKDTLQFERYLFRWRLRELFNLVFIRRFADANRSRKERD